jgi:uncharacterized protein (DUF697 family)
MSTPSKSEQADVAILAAVTSTALMGGVPFFIDVAAVIAANGALLFGLAKIYDIQWTQEQSGNFIRRLIEAGGITIGSTKLLASAITLTGVGIPVGLTINAILNGMVTLGIGRAAKIYFASECKTPDGELVTIFLNTVSLGGFNEVRKIIGGKKK